MSGSIFLLIFLNFSLAKKLLQEIFNIFIKNTYQGFLKVKTLEKLYLTIF